MHLSETELDLLLWIVIESRWAIGHCFAGTRREGHLQLGVSGSNSTIDIDHAALCRLAQLGLLELLPSGPCNGRTTLAGVEFVCAASRELAWRDAV